MGSKGEGMGEKRVLVVYKYEGKEGEDRKSVAWNHSIGMDGKEERKRMETNKKTRKSMKDGK